MSDVPITTANQKAVVPWQMAARPTSATADRVPVAKEGRDGNDAQPECEQAWVEIRFERVRARSRNVVAKRHDRGERDREPQPVRCGADSQDAVRRPRPSIQCDPIQNHTYPHHRDGTR
jgi:hypothetical protein